MFIEPVPAEEPFRSSGARYSFAWTLQFYALTELRSSNQKNINTLNQPPLNTIFLLEENTQETKGFLLLLAATCDSGNRCCQSPTAAPSRRCRVA